MSEGGVLEVEGDAACGEGLRQGRRAAVIQAEDQVQVTRRRRFGRRAATGEGEQHGQPVPASAWGMRETEFPASSVPSSPT
jgi:hypothetical protein